MRLSLRLALAIALSGGVAAAQQPSASQVAQERAQAELDVPKLAAALELTAGMTVADVGTGNGAMTVVFARWIAPGHVYSTDLDDLDVVRNYVKREGLANVTVLEGAAGSTNLPAACCDAIFLRNVYHHITEVAAFNRSLHASLKPGGRLAIIDFEASPGSALPVGVRKDRGGHGVPPAIVISEMKAAGLEHLETIGKWPPGDKTPTYFLTLFKRPE